MIHLPISLRSAFHYRLSRDLFSSIQLVLTKTQPRRAAASAWLNYTTVSVPPSPLFQFSISLRRNQRGIYCNGQIDIKTQCLIIFSLSAACTIPCPRLPFYLVRKEYASLPTNQVTAFSSGLLKQKAMGCI